MSAVQSLEFLRVCYNPSHKRHEVIQAYWKWEKMIFKKDPVDRSKCAMIFFKLTDEAPQKSLRNTVAS